MVLFRETYNVLCKLMVLRIALLRIYKYPHNQTFHILTLYIVRVFGSYKFYSSLYYYSSSSKGVRKFLVIAKQKIYRGFCKLQCLSVATKWSELYRGKVFYEQQINS